MAKKVLFQSGDRVRLKGDPNSPSMTVLDVWKHSETENRTLRCGWFCLRDGFKDVRIPELAAEKIK